MPRTRRLILPDVPLHITQRGVNRCSTFLCDEDFTRYWWNLHDALPESGCELHAYALMSNHVHLLLTPRDLTGPAELFRRLGSRYVRYFNAMHRRTGTLWEGRFRSELVDSNVYFLACCRYIELNPVRAGMVADPAEYRWSSYRHNAERGRDLLLSEHPVSTDLGVSPAARRAAYRALVAQALPDSTISALRAGQLRQTTRRDSHKGRPDGGPPWGDEAGLIARRAVAVL